MKDILLNKKNRKVFGIAILSSILFLSGLSYAYFIGSVGGSAATDVDVTTSVNERLVFTEGLPININATLDNFSDGDGSLTGETTTNVRLNAGSQSSTASELYQVYYQIETNNFEYSVDENTPELILTITDPVGNILTSAELADGTLLSSESVTTLVQDGIGGTTTETVTGFDITTLEELIILKEDYSITNTNPTVATEQNWTAKITFINLDAEQTINEGKTLNSNFMFVEEGLPLNMSILLNNSGKTQIEADTLSTPPDFANNATTNEGIFATEDDYGTSYYFRGAVDNNWVSFAGFYWRIIRINGDGSIRMIYSGAQAPTEEQKVVMTGTSTQIGTSSFNTSSELAEYVGYMYTVGEQHGISVSSVAKTTVDTWYENNILNTEYHSKIADNAFCVDRTAYTNTTGTSVASGTGTVTQYFGAYIRSEKATPTLECPDQRDAFTVDDTLNGNGALRFSAGLLSADEIIMAGIATTNNSSNYLYTGQSASTISPYYMRWNWNFATVYIVSSAGSLYYRCVHVAHNLDGLRPVISLDSSVLATGSGTWNDPYVVL